MHDHLEQAHICQESLSNGVNVGVYIDIYMLVLNKRACVIRLLYIFELQK